MNEFHPNGRALRPASFLCLAFLPLVLAFSLQRLVLQARITAYQPAPGAVLLDAGLALGVVLAALLLARLHWAPAALFLAAAALLQAADTEMVIAMDTVISPADLRQGLDGHFLQGSLSRLAAPVYAALTLGGAALAAAALARARRRGGLPPARVTAPLLAAAAAALFLLTPREGGWESASPLLLTLTRPPEAPRPLPAGERAAAAPAAGLAEGEPAAAAAAPPAGGPPAPLPTAFLPSSPAEGEPLVRRAPGAGRNVLLVVLEGIPGAYLRQVQEATGVAYPIVMPALSRIAGRSLLVPRFLAHNRQTIRGLYSLLSGDYPGLSLLTPKIYEYMRLPPESRRPCLPEILSEAGYETVFLQAADLAYMSKDQFLPRAGFRRVLGREHFVSRGGPSGWGPDDRAFFEEAARLVVELDRGEAPWFLTLLTVGTHHPYAVPDEWAARWPTRKEAAVAWLDAALEAFWARLEGEGILEDTLVVITSDESHGVTGHPFGRFWGLALAVAPEGAGATLEGAAVPAEGTGAAEGGAAGQEGAAAAEGSAGGPLLQPGVFGLVDLPHSVLDYLGLAGRTPVPGRRSLFRRQETGRPLLFGPYACLEDGTVAEIVEGGGVRTWAPAGGAQAGGPFAPAYSRALLDGREGTALAGRLRSEQKAADALPAAGPGRAPSGGGPGELVLLSESEFLLGRPGPRVLSTGQYLAFPAEAVVTVSLRAAVRAEAAPHPVSGKGGGGDAALPGTAAAAAAAPDAPAPGPGEPAAAVRLHLLVNRENEPIGLPPLRIPPLHDGESLELSFSFRSAVPLDRVWVHLSARPEEGSPPLRVRVERFAVRTGEAAGPGGGLGPEDSAGPPAGGPEAGGQPEDAPAFRLHRLEVRPAGSVPGAPTSPVAPAPTAPSATPAAPPPLDDAPAPPDAAAAAAAPAVPAGPAAAAAAPAVPAVPAVPAAAHGPAPAALPPVAHAGGLYRGQSYTNSLEALEANAGSFTHFEIDFEWTRDRELVGLHDWDAVFRRLYGKAERMPLTLEQLRERGAARGLTPLDLPALRDFLERHPRARIVTDVKSGNLQALRRIASYFARSPALLERFIPQVYRPGELEPVLALGYRSAIWTLYRWAEGSDPEAVLAVLRDWEERLAARPFAVAMPAVSAERGVAAALAAAVPVYAHTVNDPGEAERLRGLGVSAVYTDAPHPEGG